MVDRARSCGRPVACYIREVALGGKPKATRPTLSYALVRELSQVAIGLQRLDRRAKEANLDGAEAFGAAVGNVLDLIQSLSSNSGDRSDRSLEQQS